MNVPENAAVKKALKSWGPSIVKPGLSRPALTHLIPLADGRHAWTNGFMVEVTSTPDPRLDISLKPPVSDGVPSISAQLVRLLSNAPRTNELTITGTHLSPSPYSQVDVCIVFADAKGTRWAIARDYVAYLHRRYPDATWYGKQPLGALGVVNAGEIVALVMPVNVVWSGKEDAAA
ncbi:MAG TPA: hypothetical protein VNM48_15650 [Chloroflexota bacterium]|nr:hypothetical protein [Chloroflexota bacterium]